MQLESITDNLTLIANVFYSIVSVESASASENANRNVNVLRTIYRIICPAVPSS